MSVYENYESHLSSVYSKDIIGFIKRNQALGYKFKSQIWMLAQFDSYAAGIVRISCTTLDESTVVGWVQEPWLSSERMRRRALLMHQLGEYMIAQGKNAYLYPKRRYKAPARYIPYIFTAEQISRLITRADADAKQHPNIRSRVDTAVILRMLYGCGLRISEATGLQMCDVDLQDGVLRIRQSKFQKDRLVPMSRSLTAVCRKYKQKYLQAAKPDQPFFSPNEERKYSGQTIYGRFRDLIFESGIPHRGKGYGPRLHDLRHTFAVHSLKQLAESGSDLYVTLPVLSTFLGHSSVASTQWYLHLTAEVYPNIMDMVEEKFGDVYPEVCYEQETY